MGDVEMTDGSTDKEFFLSRIIPAHDADVKSIQCTSTGTIISGGRDECVRFWTKRAGDYAESSKFVQSKGLVVNSVAYYDGEDGWRLFVGRKDGSIAVYASGSSEPLTVVAHHSSNVCCLLVDSINGKLLSGSWDNTVIIWPIADMGVVSDYSAYKLCGHNMSVWALASVTNAPGFYLTGSADKTIKLWNNDMEQRTFTGHSDVVRALHMFSNGIFLSAANDATIRSWHLETGTCLHVFTSVVDEFIFSLSSSGDYIFSCGEGGNVEVWKPTQNKEDCILQHVQIVKTPMVTAWSVAALSNGDVAVGGSDGKIYIFTLENSRKAPDDLNERFADELNSRIAMDLTRAQEQQNDTVVIKVSLDDSEPNMELKYTKGTDPTLAAEQFITQHNLPISYLNEITEYIVTNIPEARAAQNKKYRTQSTQKVVVDGEAYDFAFNIVAEDGRQLVLPYNLSDDVDVVCQLFCEKHKLSMREWKKVSEMLRRNLMTGSGQQRIEDAPSTGYMDPFTGSGRYVPGQTIAGFSSGGGADPLTGVGRYIPGQAVNNIDCSGDPLTSSGGYKPGSATGALIPNACLPQDKKKPRGELVPLVEYYRFGVEALNPKFIVKLKELNEQQEVFVLSSEQISWIEQFMTSTPGSMPVGEAEKACISTGLMWSIDHIAPILDLFRMALLDETLNHHYCSVKGLGTETLQQLSALLISDSTDATRTFVCRCLTNSFAFPAGRHMASSDEAGLAPILLGLLSSRLGSLQIAATSVLANWSLYLLQQSDKVAELGPREDLIRAITKSLEPVLSFGDFNETALIRLLQAVVTLMWGDSAVISTAKSRNMVSIVNRIKDAIVDERGKNIARDIVEMTYAV